MDNSNRMMTHRKKCEKNVGFLPEFRMECVQVGVGSGLMPIFKLKIHPWVDFQLKYSHQLRVFHTSSASQYIHLMSARAGIWIIN